MSKKVSPADRPFRGSKLATTLHLLDAAEWTALADWLRSPVATTHTAPLRAYRALAAHYPNFDLTKGTLYRAIYGSAAYDNRTLNNLLSTLNRLVEDFLLLQRVRAQPERREAWLARIYRDRGALEAHERLVTQPAKSPTVPPADEWALLANLRRQHDAYFYATEERLYTNGTGLLLEARQSLLAFERLLRTKLDTEQVARARVLREAVPLLVMPPLHPIEKLYAQFEAADATSPAAVLALETAYRTQFPTLPVAYQRLFGLLLLNRLIRLSTHAAVTDALLRHVRLLDTHELLAHNGYLRGTTYLNVIGIALLAEDYAYAEELAARYEAQLPAAKRPVIVAVAQARIAFGQARFARALELARQTTGGHPRYEILRRMVLVEAQLEVALQSPTADIPWEYAINNYEKYLRRNTYYDESRIAPYLTFCLLVRQLGQALLPVVDEKRLQRLQRTLKQAKTYGRKWLEEVVARAKAGE